MNTYQKLASKLSRYVTKIRYQEQAKVEDSNISIANYRRLDSVSDSLCFSHDCPRPAPYQAHAANVLAFEPKTARIGLIKVLFPQFSFDVAELLYDIRALYEFYHVRYTIPHTEEQLLCQLLHKYEPDLEAALLRYSRFNASRAHPQERQAAYIAHIIENYSKSRGQTQQSTQFAAQTRQISYAIADNAQVRARLARERRVNEELAAYRRALEQRLETVQREKAQKLSQNDALEAQYYQMRVASHE